MASFEGLQFTQRVLIEAFCCCLNMFDGTSCGGATVNTLVWLVAGRLPPGLTSDTVEHGGF